MPPEIKTGRLHRLIRRADPDDLEAQVKALKELQKQPAFIAGRSISEANSQATFKKRWINIVVSFFRRKQKSASPSRIEGSNKRLPGGKNRPNTVTDRKSNRGKRVRFQVGK